MEIIRTTGTDKRFTSLVSELNMELTDRYGDLQDYFDNFNKTDTCNTVVLVKLDNKAIGCGCFMPFDQDTAEIKRVFVQTEYRKRGISKIILSELETWAKETGFSYIVLETGNKQPEAIGLYEKAGYQLIDNYRQYEGVETSICMKKRIFT